MVPDTAQGHLFYSQGSSSVDSILVTDLDGSKVASIGDQDGVEGLALSPDGSTLYAALGSADAVSAISTTTLTQTALYPLPAGDSPLSLAMQGGDLWVSYDVAGGPPGIGDIDLGASAPSFTAGVLPGSWSYTPYLAADPSGSGALVAGVGSVAESYDVANSPATVLAPQTILAEDGCDFNAGTTVVPGGTQVLANCGGTMSLLSTSDLSPVSGSFAPGSTDLGAAAIASNGMVAVSTNSSQSQVSVYQQQAASSPLQTYSAFYNVRPGGLAWSADGSQLYAVVESTVSAQTTVTGYDLVVLYPPLTSSSLFVQGPYQSTGGVGAIDDILGSLSIGGSPAPEGTPIDVTRTESGNGDVAKFTTTTDDALGEFESRDTLPALGTYTYVISYPGDATTAPAFYNDYEVTVVPDQTSVGFTGPDTDVAGQPITLTGDLQPTGSDPATVPPGATVQVTRTLAGSSSTASFTETTDSGGIFYVTDAPPVAGTYTYTASYTSDSPLILSSAGSFTVTVAPLAVAGTPYTPVAPVRMLDTRNGTGGFSSPVGAGKTIALQVTGRDGVPATGVTAVVLNLTATGPTASSFVTAYPDGQARPAEGSNLNFTKGETIPNLVTVPVGSDGKIDLYNSAGSVNLVADLQGYYSTSGGSEYATAGPVRVLDTRNGTGGFSSPVGAGKTIALQVTGQNGVPATGVTAVVLNLTATGPTASSFVTAYPDGQARPAEGSNLNFTKGETIPNLVIVPVGSDGEIDLYNNAGSVNLVADLFGYYVG
jgi:hypothetical protein